MKTKYPIILVHGLCMKDILFIKSFGKIDKILKDEGCEVYKSKVDGFGSIETNASILKDEILKIIDKTKCEKVNIIAHSKGGLDAKYMIQNLEMGKYVASFTTLCTPHKGSPIASGILKAPRWILKIIAFFINLWYKILGDKKPNALKVCEELALVNSVEEETFTVDKGLYCQSYSSHIEKARDTFIDAIPFIFFRLFDKTSVTDGLVSEDSSKFGEYKGPVLDESIGHAAVTDFMAQKKKKEKLYAFYKTIIEDLNKRGY